MGVWTELVGVRKDLRLRAKWWHHVAVGFGVFTALLAYLGFVLPVQATHILFGNYGEFETKFKLLGINTGGQLLSLLTMGVVIGFSM